MLLYITAVYGYEARYFYTLHMYYAQNFKTHSSFNKAITLISNQPDLTRENEKCFERYLYLLKGSPIAQIDVKLYTFFKALHVVVCYSPRGALGGRQPTRSHSRSKNKCIHV